MLSPAAWLIRRAFLTALAGALAFTATVQAAPPAVRTSPWLMVDAFDDEYSVASGTPIEILEPGVVANDHIPAGSAITVRLISGPAHGTLKLGTSGAFVYLPGKGFSGTDTFRYGLSDGASKDEADVKVRVVASVDVALTATVTPAHVEPGKPATIVFRAVNQGSSAVSAIRLDVTVPVVVSGAQVRPDGRCSAPRFGKWACPMGALPVGGEVAASFTVTLPAPGWIEVGGVAVTMDDINPLNDRAVTAFDAGRLSLDPGHVTLRLPWTGLTPKEPVTLPAFIANETVAPLTYQVQAVGSGSLPPMPPAWLVVQPASGTADPMSARATKLIFSTAGVSPGLQRAGLQFTHDSPFAFGDVAVSFTVAFRDVPDNRKDDPYIHALAGAGVTAGCGAGVFCPDDLLTRAGASVWLLLSSQGAAYQPLPARGIFGDVSVERPDAGFVEDAFTRGVVEPCGSDPALFFCPDKALARADAAVTVIRMIEGPDYEPPVVPPTFIDLAHDARAMFVEDAVRRGFFSGCTTTFELKFCPHDGLKRGDAAVALVRAFNLPMF